MAVRRAIPPKRAWTRCCPGGVEVFCSSVAPTPSIALIRRRRPRPARRPRGSAPTPASAQGCGGRWQHGSRSHRDVDRGGCQTHGHRRKAKPLRGRYASPAPAPPRLTDQDSPTRWDHNPPPGAWSEADPGPGSAAPVAGFGCIGSRAALRAARVAAACACGASAVRAAGTLRTTKVNPQLTLSHGDHSPSRRHAATLPAWLG